MTVARRPESELVTVRPPARQRVTATLTNVRVRAAVVTRRQAWTAWRVARQVPASVALLLAWSPRGLARITAAWARYLRDHDTAQLRAHHAGARESADYERVSRARSANLTARLMVNGTAVLAVLGVVLAWTAPRALGVLLAGLVFVWTVKLIPGRGLAELVAAGGLALLAYLATPWLATTVPVPPGWLWWLAGAVAVLVLGWVGRPRARPLVTLPGVAEGGRVPPLTAPMVTEALCTLGNSKMREPDSIRLLTDPHRHGPGVQVDLELPPAVPASFVQGKREEFAAALRRELGTVWPAVGTRHPGHLALFVSDQPLASATQEPWPLRRRGEVDLFAPVPAFTDQRGAWVGVTLAYSNMIIGAVPRIGKTFVLRQLLLIAGLDVTAKVIALDGKGTGDLSACAHFAHVYLRGARPDRPEQIAQVLDTVRWLRKELGRRADIIDALPFDQCPESKVTAELVRARPDLDLGPIVVGIDETQSYFSYGDDGNRDHKAIRQELRSGVTELVKLGPALGIIVLLATQQVNDATIPTSIANNAVIRFAMKLEGHEPNDRILGTGSYKRGIDATMFDLDDKGIGYLKADGAAPRIVRSVYGLDAPAANEVALRARALRAGVGMLTGAAADDEPVFVVLDEVADVERVLADRSRPTAHLVELVEWLGELRPEYAGLDVDELGKRLRNRGVQVRKVKVAGRTTSGVRAADLRKHDDGNAGDPGNLEDE
ncbi:FtsK/SpoIIIE domain-containing protein [Pseudonocardia asaccharolytica]|uniref:Cell division protein FtsK n=1 Tax=Pseudonocardia asaccharolytica DSM 44247 = NBRC 16224 TaxID=1123024 RepID=A0A511CYU8_9PSEU|nr:FtsK/SpoIIIE domain-containing protein [Pseudonocardia asaccharolytica]GEL17706.1 cell division protein FtsK [Pseudonocardia asaccharolytica DSM 44247 = NBRC 16224]